MTKFQSQPKYQIHQEVFFPTEPVEAKIDKATIQSIEYDKEKNCYMYVLKPLSKAYSYFITQKAENCVFISEKELRLSVIKKYQKEIINLQKLINDQETILNNNN